MTDIVERLRVNMHAYGIAQEAADEIERLRAELAEAKDGWHMANGVADLAMKHRDLAEKECDRLRELLLEALPIVIESQTYDGHTTDTPSKLLQRIDAATGLNKWRSHE